MGHTKVFEKIDQLRETYLNIWEQACDIESPTKYKEGVDAVGTYLAGLAREKGWRVEVYPQSVSGDVVVITMNPDAKGAPVSLSGHLDTVYPRGIDASADYRVTLDNSGATTTVSGYSLRNEGIRVRLDGALQSELILLERV